MGSCTVIVYRGLWKRRFSHPSIEQGLWHHPKGWALLPRALSGWCERLSPSIRKWDIAWTATAGHGDVLSGRGGILLLEARNAPDHVDTADAACPAKLKGGLRTTDRPDVRARRSYSAYAPSAHSTMNWAMRPPVLRLSVFICLAASPPNIPNAPMRQCSNSNRTSSSALAT